MEKCKKCTDCGLEKPLKEFNISSRYKDKEYRLSFCGKCAWIRRKNSKTPSNYYYAINPEAWNAYQREYARRKNKERKNKI